MKLQEWYSRQNPFVVTIVGVAIAGELRWGR